MGLLLLSSDTKFIHGICWLWQVVFKSCTALDDVTCQGVVLFIDCNIFNFHYHVFNLCFSYCLLLYFVVSFKLNIRSWVWWYQLLLFREKNVKFKFGKGHSYWVIYSWVDITQRFLWKDSCPSQQSPNWSSLTPGPMNLWGKKRQHWFFCVFLSSYF